MRHQSKLLLSKLVALLLFCAASAAPQSHVSPQEETWLWVMDQHAHIGVAGASVEIGPGRACIKNEALSTDTKSISHYATGPAGRVLVHGLPPQFSCRVTLKGRELSVESSSRGDSEAILFVDPENRGIETVEDDYWRTTNDPTQFRAYIQDHQTRLIPGVRVRDTRSGATATSDRNGLFTIEVAARYRKGRFPSLATDTLVFSKPGYRALEYRDLVLNPGVNPLSIILERGSGTVVRRNLSLGNGEDEVFTFDGPAQAVPRGYTGEITSFEVEPSSVDAGWILCGRDAKAILKGRNLQSVEIFLYPTGTGLGEHGPYSVGQMKKVLSSSGGDTWELPLPSLMTTNFWAEAIDTSGKRIKSIDLGNVGY